MKTLDDLKKEFKDKGDFAGFADHLLKFSIDTCENIQNGAERLHEYFTDNKAEAMMVDSALVLLYTNSVCQLSHGKEDKDKPSVCVCLGAKDDIKKLIKFLEKEIEKHDND